MKPYSMLIISVITITLALTACKKDSYSPYTGPARTIKFILYTEEDFSGDNKNITFSLFIRTHSKTLFDSAFSVMKIKDIPGPGNKLIVEKTVPHDDGSDLAAGFDYTIENVGMSWHLDTLKAGGETYKTIEYSFK